jgi:hypothetical protein
MSEEWILHPESILARDLKHFDAAFRAYAAARPSNENLGRFRIGRWHEIEEPCSISNWPWPERRPFTKLKKLRLHEDGRLPEVQEVNKG